MEQIYRLVIQNGEKRFELESTDKNWLEKQKSELVKSLSMFDTASRNQIKQMPEKPEPVKKPSLKKITINEFSRKYCPQRMSNVDRVVFFIYYLGWVENKKQVSMTDVKNLFIQVGIPNANNINYSAALSRAKKRALLNSIDNSWSLTITGEDFVLNKMQDIDKK